MLASKVKNGFGSARRIHSKAVAELAHAKAERDRLAIRQAAEKGWLSVVEATKALMRSRGKAPPGGTGRQRDALVKLGRANRRAKKLHLLFETARSVLHVSCFYDDEVDLPVIETVFEDVDEFIRAAERFANGTS